MKPPRTIDLRCLEFGTAHEAIQHTQTDPEGVAIRLNGKNLVVLRGDADRLAAARVAFAYLGDHHGRVVTVPVNG
jgi:hypothetical protein